MDELKSTIIGRMKKIRFEKQFSLEQAAEITGISKAMLSQIERGQSVPTVTTLWKIATGYKVPLTYFLEEEKSSYSLIDYTKSQPLSEENGEMRIYTVKPYDPFQNFEMLYIEFEPGCVHSSAKHMDGVEEYVFVQRGALELWPGIEKISVSENQCFRFKADIPHAYKNNGNEKCCIINMIFYPAIVTPSGCAQ